MAGNADDLLSSSFCDEIFDLNHAIDLLLPCYLILIFYIIFSFASFQTTRPTTSSSVSYKRLTSQQNQSIKQIITPTVIASSSMTSTSPSSSSSTWKTSLVGYWNICWADNLDQWLQFLKRPYVRNMAQTMFFQIHQRISLLEEDGQEYLIFERERGGKLSNWVIKILLGKSEEDSNYVEMKDHEDILTRFHAWINEETQELYLQTVTVSDGDNKKKNHLQLTVSRKLIDENTIVMNWEGLWIDSGERAALKTHAKRIKDS